MNAFLLLFSLLGFSQENVCLSSHPKDVKDCLNQVAQQSIHDAEIRFTESLRDIVTSQNLNHFFELRGVRSLQDTFQVAIPDTKDSLGLSDKACFDFSDTTYRPGLGNARIVPIIERQLREVVQFLRVYHTFSLGAEASYLYQIRRVEVCSGEDEITFDKNVLKIGLSLDYAWGEPYFTAEEIYSMWNNGTIVFGEPLGFIGKAKAAYNKDIESLLKDRLRDSWIILNPIGSIRYHLRIAIQKGTLAKVKSLLGGLNFRSTLSELGVNLDSEINEDKVKTAFQQTLLNPDFINQITEQALFAKNVGSYRLENIDKRKQVALIAVKNNKQINIDLSGLFSTGYSSEELLGSETPQKVVSIESDSWQVSGVAIDLIDQVNVNVAIPSNLLQTIQRLALKKAIEDTSVRQP